MPIDNVAPGDEVTDIKTNEIIAAVNSLQDGIGGPLVWGHGTANPLTLTLSFGRWIVDASAGLYDNEFNTHTLSIDGEVMCTTPSGGDTDGVNVNPLGGIKEINVTDETQDIDILVAGGDSVVFLKAMAHRVF